jgi:hypothetical protein
MGQTKASILKESTEDEEPTYSEVIRQHKKSLSEKRSKHLLDSKYPTAVFT